ncbi:outer dense fiber protein 2-like [Denticeps clupeoides]|uniref:Outer dense fiber protein 2-like n=1 Tax=Denticeps clupeoides TaxID=299321 RepID=A0AAY4E3X6_9TELE|nr:outer dense fiber protein 2-like [Denticeps clupeoides]XP_028833299.1 outer dense fiber protein 2-like [Denticeps clupeoides]
MDELYDQHAERCFETPTGTGCLSLEDPFHDTLLNSRVSRNEPPLSAGDLNGISDAGSRTHLNSYRCLSDERSSYDDIIAMDKGCLLKTLIDAESAASSAAIQLVSFKDLLENGFADSRCCSSLRLSQQKGLLLEKLEDFKCINRSVRQQLKDFQEQEACRLETDRHINALLKKLVQNESENQHLKSSLAEKEIKVEELMALRKKEIENTESVVQLSRSVDSIHVHLQDQLCIKETANKRLSVQLRGLEQVISQQKLEIEDLRNHIAAVSEKASQEKDMLKKAIRAQKQRAERFEAEVEKTHEQLREKDVKLAEACAERDLWKMQQGQIAEERVHLDTEIAILKDEITGLSAELSMEREAAVAANDGLVRKVEMLNVEKGELGLENAALKASIAELEIKLEHSLTVCHEQSMYSQERKAQVEQYQTEVVELQAEVTDLKVKLKDQLRETQSIQDGRVEEVAKVRVELLARVSELEVYPELLTTVEQALLDCQDHLRRCERTCAEQADTLRQHQLKADRQTEKLKASVEMKESITKSNSELQERVEALQKRLEQLQEENRDLVNKLTAQDEALEYSNRKLDQRTAECQTLSTQLENFLTDVKQQVCKVQEKTLARESTLQAQVQELTKEWSRRQSELKQLKQNKISSERRYELRLKDLQLSLDQSQSQKQSIQNYVDFLKNSYSTMFDEDLPSRFGSLQFLK